MKSGIVASALCLLLSGGMGTTQADDPALPAQAQTSFALRLYRSVSGEGINTLVSPAGVTATLAMVCAGARGATANQFATVLGVRPDPALIHSAFGKLTERIVTDCKQEQCVLKTANAVWVPKGRSLLPNYSDTLKNACAAEAAEVDFASDPEAARKEINSWVKRQTAGKIADLLPSGSPGAVSSVVLTSAAYFKGMWATAFDRDETADSPFTLFDGTSIMAPTMRVTAHFAYAENDRCQALELPYADSPYSMVVLLPRGHDEIRDFDAWLNEKSLTHLLSGMTTDRVQASLPRITIRFKMSLARHLQAMGLTAAFSAPPADFSGMDGSKDLFISNVVHGAVLEVSEEGTEAATGAQLISTSNRQVKEFTADRPFLFFIRHRDAGSILFMGCILHPLR